MATDPVLRPGTRGVVVSDTLRKLLDLTETDSHYVYRALSGAMMTRSKSEIRYPWQLLRGIMDDGKDTSEERRREREWETAHDQRKFGGTPQP